MGGLCELGAVACSRHKKNIAELIMRKNAPLRTGKDRAPRTLGTSLPMIIDRKRYMSWSMSNTKIESTHRTRDVFTIESGDAIYLEFERFCFQPFTATLARSR